MPGLNLPFDLLMTQQVKPQVPTYGGNREGTTSMPGFNPPSPAFLGMGLAASGEAGRYLQDPRETVARLAPLGHENDFADQMKAEQLLALSQMMDHPVKGPDLLYTLLTGVGNNLNLPQGKAHSAPSGTKPTFREAPKPQPAAVPTGSGAPGAKPGWHLKGIAGGGSRF